MENIYNILNKIRPELDFKNADNYIKEGMLDSLDIIHLVAKLDKTFSISIDGSEIIPDNFYNAESIFNLVKKSGGITESIRKHKHSSMANMITYYKELYCKYGYSPDSLGWHKGKQFLRFHQLTSDWDLNNSTILDVGCGFGDFNKYLQLLKINNYNYTGVDIIDDFIDEANMMYKQKNIKFIKSDFATLKIKDRYDYVIASGTFNFKIDGVENYDYIYKNMKKMFDACEKAISIDFITDKADMIYEHNFNSCPEKILAMAYGLSKRVILKNNYFPFEFSVTIYKNDSFVKETTVFSENKNQFL